MGGVGEREGEGTGIGIKMRKNAFKSKFYKKLKMFHLEIFIM